MATKNCICKCQGCGVLFKPKKADRLKYCSRECAFDNLSRKYSPLRLEINALKRISKQTHKELLPFNVLIEKHLLLKIAKANKKSYENVVNTRSYKPCEHCKSLFVFTVTMGRHPKYCKTCHKVVFNEIRKKHAKKFRKKQRELGIRSHTHIKRAKKYKVEFDRKLSAIDVFDRDKWRCQLCGIATPKKLKGTLKPNAPELDHIVPLSKGGPHTLKNVQCCCRSCNIKKSDKPLGQLLMF
jgi:5-methylcytosine-specific restriction endonuclease McrA